MDYSKYSFTQLTEALTAIDKNAYPDNYKALSAAIQEYPREKLQAEAFTDEVSPMGINQLKIRLVETSIPEHRRVIEEFIRIKTNRLTKVKIWLKWIGIIIATAIVSVFVPKDFKSISGIIVLVVLSGSLFMAIKQHRAFNKSISEDAVSSKD